MARHGAILMGSKAPPKPSTSAIKYWIAGWAVSGASDGGTLATTDVVDQSSSALGNAASILHAVYRANGGTGTPAIEFNGSDSYVKSPSFTITQPLTVFAVIKQLIWPGSNDRRFWDANTVNKAVLTQNGAYSARNISMYTGSSYGPENPHAGMESAVLVEAYYNGASSTLKVNGNSALPIGPHGSPGTNGFPDGTTLGGPGNLLAGYFASYRLFEWIVCDSTMSGADETSIRAWLNYKHSLPVAPSGRLVYFLGNSITLGQGAVPGVSDYPTYAIASLTEGYAKWRVYGIGGRSTTQLNTDASTVVASFGSWPGGSIVIPWEICNDILNNGATGTTAYNNYVTLCGTLRAAGFKVIAVTSIARGDASWTGTMDTYRLAANTSVVANWATFADALWDPAADSRFQTPTNTTYYAADKIHPNANGNSILGGLVAPVVSGLG
jgi:lysophospholipase L1-like esterase